MFNFFKANSQHSPNFILVGFAIESCATISSSKKVFDLAKVLSMNWSTITKVPALLLLNHSHHVLFGEQIYNHLQPKQQEINTEATYGNEEPLAYGLNQMNSISDSYSFWDQSSDDLSA